MSKTSVTCQDILEQVYQKCYEQNILVKKYELKEIVDATFASMVEAILLGNTVKIRGFGSFYVRKRKPYSYCTPTGENGITEAKNKVIFRPSKMFDES